MSSRAGVAGFQTYLDLVGSLRAAAQLLAGFPETAWAVPSEELGSLMGELTRIQALTGAAQVITVREAASRGVIARSDAAGPTDWVIAQTPDTELDNTPASGTAPIPAADAATLARVAFTCLDPQWAALDRALVAGQVSARMADRVVTEHSRLRDALPESMHAEVLAGFLTLAKAGVRPTDLGRFRDRLLADYARQGLLQARHDKLATHRGMSGFTADLDGMYRATLVLDPESHAVIAPVIEALSVPAPGTDENGRRVPDPRTADQRRTDALVEVCTAYQQAGPKVRLGTATRLVVTMGIDDLRRQVGSGQTPTGDVLPPETVRRLACDAGIIPVVLGSESRPLDVGRESRLATPAQLVALGHRDKGCTFPGCDRPPGWTQAHHLLHWLDLWPTDLDNLTLLCRRHHTVVHQRGYTATVTPTGVTWHR